MLLGTSRDSDGAAARVNLGGPSEVLSLPAPRTHWTHEEGAGGQPQEPDAAH